MRLETPDLVYQTTRYSTYACEYHIIWCTKYRRSALSDEIQARFKELVLESEEKYGRERDIRSFKAICSISKRCLNAKFLPNPNPENRSTTDIL